MAIAKTEGTCGRCHQTIPVGMSYFWSNANHARYHWKDTDGRCSPGATRSAVPNEGESPESVVTPQPITPAVPGSIDAIIDARIDSRLSGFNVESVRGIAEEAARTALAGGDWREEMQRAIDKALDSRPAQVIEVQRPKAAPVTIDGAHYLMPRLLRLIGAGIHVYLWGPAGSGKTTAALQAAHALGLIDSEIDTLDSSTPKSAILGYRTVTGEPVETAFTRCYSRGQGYIADELDNAPAQVQSIKNSALANHHAPTPWGMVARAESFIYVGTGNTPGEPTKDFPDRKRMSVAFKDRLYFVYWPLDPAIECRAAGLPVPRAPRRVERTCTPQQWVTWVQAVRAWAAQNAPTLMVTPRASLTGLQALAVGETPEEVADGLVFRGADKPLVDKVLTAVPLPC